MSDISEGKYDQKIGELWTKGFTDHDIAQFTGQTFYAIRHRRQCLGYYENRNASPAQRAREAEKYKQRKRDSDNKRSADKRQYNRVTGRASLA